MKNEEQKLSENIAEYLEKQYKDIMFRFDIGADIRLTIGQATRVKNKLRHKRGYPDLFIAEMVNGYGGLYVELKKDRKEVYKLNGEFKKSEHLEEQIKFHEKLRQKGYQVVFGLGFDDTVIKIKEYLKELEDESN